MAVLLVALTVVMALGIIGVPKTVSASPDNTDNRNDKGHTTLTVLVKTREIRLVALNPQGPSHGDVASSTPRPTTKAEQRGSGASTCSAS